MLDKKKKMKWKKENIIYLESEYICVAYNEGTVNRNQLPCSVFFKFNWMSKYEEQELKWNIRTDTIID